MGKYLKNLFVSFGIMIFLPGSFPAFADTKLVNLRITTTKNQNFNHLMQQAELIAINSIMREFNSLSITTEVDIIVSGEHNGQEVPLLSTKVSRKNWQAQPIIQSWTKYYPKAGILLGFNLPQTNKPRAAKVSTKSNFLENDPGFRDD